MNFHHLENIWASWNTEWDQSEAHEDLEEMPSTGTLTLKRSGKFTLEVRGENHCGVHKPNVECTYEVRLVCTPNSVDPHGFLVEQLGIHDFFQSLPTTELSCERLVVWCNRKLREKIQAENPSCVIHKMEVTISPLGNVGQASMTYEWEPS